MTLSHVYVLIGVAIAVALGAIGSSIGVGQAARTAAGLLSKEPKKFPQALIMVALPSTQSLYGLLFGFILLIQTGLLSGTPAKMTDVQGLAFMMSALPVGVACLISGIFQGLTAASGMKILANKPESFSQGVILASLIESFAIFGLVISLLTVFVGIPLN
jgi:V/A-type H+/Na+-transporting ATPase subunit K